MFITSTAIWGEWNPPTRIGQPWLEDRVIPWPIDYDIVDACDALRKAGYSQSFSTVTLRWVLYPGVDEPSYIFGLSDGYFIFVGVYTHKVYPPVTMGKD